MNDIKKAVLKIAKENPEFRRALVAELRKESRLDQKEAGSKEDLSRHVKRLPQAVRRLEQYTRKQDWQSARWTLQAIQNELKDADWLLMGLVP